MHKLRKLLTVMVASLILSVALTSLPVFAAETKTMTDVVQLQFGTDKVISPDGKTITILFKYQAFSTANPSNAVSETIQMGNAETITRTSKTLSVNVAGADGLSYKGSFAFSYSYDAKTGTASVNGTPISLSQKTPVDANVYPEAWLDPAIIGVSMDPLPFSQVKAIVSPKADYVAEFNARINGGINDKIILATSQYGTNIQSNTTLKMFITLWERNADGSYNTTVPKVTKQVIYSAADIINGAATSSDWTGSQFYRQLVPVVVSGHTLKPVESSVATGRYRTEYQVQDYVRTDLT
ncbi:MAG: hypothetical protein AB9921_02480 [Erysipelotrichaceae bacterium]